jgi:hypothetical protein
MGTGPVVETICFMVLFAALVAVGFATLMFTARCVLVVVQETGQGQDEILWPKEPYQDWLVHAAQFIELLGIWIFPAALAARLLRHSWLEDDGFLRILFLVGPGLWLFFPVGLLSSLSASSRWVPFRWTIVRQLFRIFPATVGFYFLTAIVVGVCAVPWYYAIAGQSMLLLPVAALVGAAGVFIYARLLGRIALLIQRLPGEKSAPARPKAAARKPARPGGANRPSGVGRKKKRKPAAEVNDPWAVPEEERPRSKKKKSWPWAEEDPKPKPKKAYTPPTPDEIEAYGVAAEQPAAPPPEEPAKRPRYPAPEDYEAITARPAEGQELPRSEAVTGSVFEREVEQRLAERTRAELPVPAHPLLSGVYTFPWYPQTVAPWLALSVALLAVGGIAQQMLYFGGIIFGWQ